MIDMQTRIRQKEAKRKEVEAENTVNKKRCEREERRAEVQLRAYWDHFPLPAQESDDVTLSGDHRDTETNCSQKYVPRIRCSHSVSTKDRQDYIDNLRASIAERADPDAKRIKPDPQNSGDGDDPAAVNRDVDLATKDRMHTGIQIWGPRASIKRACTFDELSRSCKASKKEMRSILNICDTGKSG